MDMLSKCTYLSGPPDISDPQIHLFHGFSQEHGSFQRAYKDEFIIDKHCACLIP